MAIWSRAKFNRLSKGFVGRRKNCFVVQCRAVFKSLQYQYIWRRLRRRVVKVNNIKAINAAAREHGFSYNKFIFGLNRSNILLDRKILADLAKNEPFSFKAVFDEVSSKVKLPTRRPDEVSFEEALQKGLLYHGEYIQKDTRHRIARPFYPKEGEPDYFGTTREDFPYFYKEQDAEYFRKYAINEKIEKKLPAEYYDDLPDVEDDNRL